MNIEQIYNQLSPNNRKLAEQLIKQLALQDGVSVDIANEYLLPAENFSLWLASMKTEGKSPRTIDLYRISAAAVLKKVPQPDAMNLQQYYANRLNEISAEGVNSEQKAVKSLFSYLYKHGLYPSDPARDIKLVRGADKQVEFPTPEQMAAVTGYIPRRAIDRPKYRTMLVLLASTGLRIEEACSLRRDMINYDILEIKVLGKGNKERIIPINPLTAALLQEYATKHCPKGSPFVFSGNTKTGYWNGDGFNNMLKSACRQAKVRAITPHKLRHYFATTTLEHGAKLEIISKILGHANVAITAKVYRHIQLKEYHDELKKHDPLKDLPLLLTSGDVIEGKFTEVK